MNRDSLLALAAIYDDRANAAESGELVAAWSQAADELRRVALGADVVAEAHIANGYCPTCGNDLNSYDPDCMDERHDRDSLPRV